jgi:hypothetical protein
MFGVSFLKYNARGVIAGVPANPTGDERHCRKPLQMKRMLFRRRLNRR